MSDTNYFTCSCQHCAGHIEFPATGVGLRVACPHCGQTTELARPAAATSTHSAQQPKAESHSVPVPGAPAPKSRVKWRVIVVIVLLAGAGGAVAWLRSRAVAHSNPISTAGETSPDSKPTKPSKSLADLKVSGVTLDRAPQGGLIHAVGTVRNESDFERFGIKIELDVIDDRGVIVSVARDYMARLESRKEWAFRALVLDSRAVGVKLSALTEDP